MASKPAEETTELNINNFIERLLLVQNKPGKPAKMNLNEIIKLNFLARKLFLSEPNLIDVKAPLNVCGDIHGQYYDLLRIFNLCGYPQNNNYLFLGDYVDRGKQSLETICLLFAYKIRNPVNFTLLRGNHESSHISRIYGFYDECKRRYNIKLWKTFTDTFNCLPVAAIIDDKIFCCHGGLSPEFLKSNIKTLADLKSSIREINRPIEVPEMGMLCDLLWSDPWYPIVPLPENFEKISGWKLNERGVSFQFGPDVIDEFLQKFDLTLIARAHQVVEDGYEFYADRSLLTVFSAPNYCGEFDNAGAVFCLNFEGEEREPENMIGSFKVLKPDLEIEKWCLTALNKG